MIYVAPHKMSSNHFALHHFAALTIAHGEAHAWVGAARAGTTANPGRGLTLG
jgi:hypothetical protein